MTTPTSLPSLTVDAVPIDDLRPDPANPRRISEDELDALERSLRQFGFVQPVLARREDRTVIGGHQRLVAARRLGLTTVPVMWLDVSVEQARLLGLALNKISGSWDDALLARLLADLQTTPDVDLSRWGQPRRRTCASVASPMETTPHGRPVAPTGEPAAIGTPRSRATRGSTGRRRSPSSLLSLSGTSGTPGSTPPRWPRASSGSASRSWPR